jgi:hypothetical protein
VNHRQVADDETVNRQINSTTTKTNLSNSCALCGIAYDSGLDQRSHLRSDLHRYNLKLKIRNQKPLTEADFERLIGDLDESISGSDDSSSDEDDSESREDLLSKLLKKKAHISGNDFDDDSLLKKKSGSPSFWFKSSELDPNTNLGVYKGLFSLEEQDEPLHLLDSLRKKQVSSLERANGPQDSDRHAFLCMIGGGHFAGMLVSLHSKKVKKSGVFEYEPVVLAHKTFHRYTTRRKQGGSQSAQDASGSKASSAGATLRRYGESALREEVRELLDAWREDIDSAELLFIRASGAHSRRTLFGPYDGQVISTKDRRLRGFPFNTKRATQSELIRAFTKLTTLQVSHVDEAALAAAEKAAAVKAQEQENLATEKQKAVAIQEKQNKELRDAENRSSHIVGLIGRSKASALFTYLQSNSISSTWPLVPSLKYHHAPFMLHYAASKNSVPSVAVLLLKAEADPTLQNQAGKTAYELSGNRAVRDMFRFARHELGEDRWDWSAAKVGDPLTKEVYLERDALEKTKEEQLAEAEEKEREEQRRQLRLAEENAAKNAKGSRPGKSKAKSNLEPGSHVLGSGSSSSGPNAERGLTEEVKRRLEREKRARAMEERIKRLQGGS